MAEMVKKRKLVNPGRRKRKRNMSALQKLFFGSKRQRAAAKAAKSNRGKRRKKRNIHRRRTVVVVRNTTRRRKRNVARPRVARRRRRRNVRHNISSIVTVYPMKRNPSRRKRGTTVARRRRRANPRRYHRRRRNYGTVIGRSFSHTKIRGRRRNPGRRRHYRRHNAYRRRNPGIMSGTMQSVLGVLGGLALTRTICTFVPAQFATGILGYAVTGAIAVGQGQLVGKISKNATLGHYFMVGGLAYMVNKILNDFIPQLGGYTGLGLIGGSSFYVPQVNQNGSMGSFVLPQQVTGAISSAMVPPPTTTTGIRGLCRTGRLM